MARILLGWELGGGSGHAIRLAAIARILAARGHEPVFVLQQIGAITGAPVWQSPLWPAQLTTLSRSVAASPATMGDILVALGILEPAAFAAMIGAWDRMLAAIRPDAVLAEFAPALTTAAAGRVPVLGVGTGFSLPPGDMSRFPSLTGAPAVHDEAAALDHVNAALAGQGRARLPSLPSLFASPRQHSAAFSEFDPYLRWRREPAGLPSLGGDVPLATGGGHELFVYLNGIHSRPPTFWQGLALSKLPVRIHDPTLAAGDRNILRSAGLKLDEAPVPFAAIAARSRLVLSHGGMGFVSSALLAGLPHVAVPYDLEKQLTANALKHLGVGVVMPFEEMQPEPFAEFLRRAYNDAGMIARSRGAAATFRSRMIGESHEQSATMVMELAAG